MEKGRMNTKKMSPEEMTRRVNEIIDQAWIYREAQSYGELMVAAYNLYGLLYYDFGVEHPTYDYPCKADKADEPFVF